MEYFINFDISINLCNLFSVSSYANKFMRFCFFYNALISSEYFYSELFGINRIIDWIASRSYSLYCCHIVSWYIVKQVYAWLGIEYNKNGAIYCIIFMIFSAEFSYRYIENILIKKK